jgi:hypothetical protein
MGSFQWKFVEYKEQNGFVVDFSCNRRLAGLPLLDEIDPVAKRVQGTCADQVRPNNFAKFAETENERN